ncbi:MAG: lipoprotein-releasing ABC transporter permease subunit [Moraxella sp.]|nr:lipoprotein-releasing ABC transporter permease subunit [Moraxella sp.]
MFRPLALFIGLRYIRAERKNGFISFISLMTLLGLTLGVTVLITVLSVMNGFDREIKTRILGMVPQATVQAYEIIPDWQDIATEIQKDPNVVATAPYIHLQGMLTANGQVSGVMITGIEPSEEVKVSIVDDFMTAGRLESLQAGEFGIVLGEQMVRNMGLALGDKVTLVLPEASPSPAGVIPRFKRFTLVGTFKISNEVDGNLGFVAMRDAGVLLRLPEGAQGVRMKLNDIFKANQTAILAANIAPERLMPTNWQETHGNLFGAIQMEKAIIGLLLFLIVIVAAFNIVSSLVMLVTDKKSDIAILKTFGASPRLIMQIFMVQGMLIGVVGTVLGVIFGVILALTVNDILVFVTTLTGASPLQSGVYPVDFLPSEVRVLDVAIIAGASFLLSFLMTIYPAWSASRIQPAQTLRYE